MPEVTPRRRAVERGRRACVGVLLSLMATFGGCRRGEVEAVHWRVGYAVEAPYAYLDASGQVTGESPEVMRAVVARAGDVIVEWRLMEFRELIPALEAGRIDAAAAGLFVTPERQKRVNFGTPTFIVDAGLLVPAGNPRQWRSYEACIREGARVAVVSGSVEEAWLRQQGGGKIKPVADAAMGKLAVELGEAEVLFLSGPTVRWLAARAEGKVEAVRVPTPVGMSVAYGAIAFPAGGRGRELADRWNAAAEGWLGRTEHAALVARFGWGAENIPSRKEVR